MAPFYQGELAPRQRRLRGFIFYILIFIGCLLIYKFVIRDSLIWVISRALPPKEAALMLGMLLGEKGNFDKETVSVFRDSGIIHIVVVSGTNIVLIFRGLVENLAGWWGRKRAIVFGFGVTLIYMDWVGWQIPAIRAFLLVMIFYWAQLLGRKFNLWRALILVVILMIVSDYRVFFDISFYLSIVAFVAVVINFRKEKYWWSDLWDAFWVNLWLLPILVFCFGKVSLMAAVTNFLVLFLIEIITLVGMLGGILGLIVPVLGNLILWLSLPLLKYILFVSERLAFGVELKFNWWWAVGWYLILIYLLISNRKISLRNFL